jgi:hypothetical protein
VRGKPFPKPFFLGYRESAGTVIAQIAYKHVARLAESFLKEGDCGVFNEDAMQYSQLQIFSRVGNSVCTLRRSYSLSSGMLGARLTSR